MVCITSSMWPGKVLWAALGLHTNNWDSLASRVSLVVKKCQCRRLRRHRVHPWLRKIPWRGAWQLSIPGESPWTEEPGGLQSTGLQRVGHNQSDLAHIQFRFPEEAKSLSCGLYTKSQLKLPSHLAGIYSTLNHKPAKYGYSDGLNKDVIWFQA